VKGVCRIQVLARFDAALDCRGMGLGATSNGHGSFNTESARSSFLEALDPQPTVTLPTSLNVVDDDGISGSDASDGWAKK
jgi:hypothetical protein